MNNKISKLKFYKYALIQEPNKIILFNDSTISFNPTKICALENVYVFYNGNNLVLKGDEITYKYYHSNKVWENDWKFQPEASLIKEGKKHWWSKKKEKYTDGGWVKTTQRKKVCYELVDYIIKIYP